jgi:hypothetical protein
VSTLACPSRLLDPPHDDHPFLRFPTRKSVTFVSGYVVAMKGMGTLSWAPRGLLTLAAGAVLLGGCGNTTPATAAQSSAAVSTTAGASPTSPASALVVTAYINATAAFVHAEKAMDPNDPALLATMTGQELSTVKKNLIIDRAGGLIARGDITTSDPHVTSLDGQTAVLRDCQYSALLLYDARTGGPAPGVANGPQNIAVTTTMVTVDGTWRVALQDGRVGTCPIGY